MDASLLQAYAERIEADLRHNLLPFWLRIARDPQTGRFRGEVSNDLVVRPQVERGSLLTCRILWTFSAAFQRFGEPAYREMADQAYADLLSRFFDAEHGGFYWSVDGNDQPLRTRKQVYGQAFAIYALAEYHAAGAGAQPLEQAIALHRLLEQHARDHTWGGYFEAYARDWSPIADHRLSEVDLNEPKSQNTVLHVMEAYTRLLHLWPDEQLRQDLRALVETMLTRVLNPQTGHLGLFFSPAWEPRSDRISYGHDIEASWLLWEAAGAVGDAALRERVRSAVLQIAEVTLREGVDHDGAIFNEGNPTGVTDTKREWWPQAEAVVGFLNAAELSDDAPRFVAAALATWDYIERNLIDREHGEWFRYVTRDGRVGHDQPKVSFWKCPYHNGRAELEAPRRLRALAQRWRTASSALTP